MKLEDSDRRRQHQAAHHCWHHSVSVSRALIQSDPCVDTLQLWLSSCCCGHSPVWPSYLGLPVPSYPAPPWLLSKVSPTIQMISVSLYVQMVKPTLDFLLPCFVCSVLSPLAMVLPPPLVTIVSSPRSSSVLTGILTLVTEAPLSFCHSGPHLSLRIIISQGSHLLRYPVWSQHWTQLSSSRPSHCCCCSLLPAAAALQMRVQKTAARGATVPPLARRRWAQMSVTRHLSLPDI